MSHPHQSLAALIRFVRDRSPFYRDAYAHLPENVAALEQLPVLNQDAFWEANGLHDNRLLTAPMRDGLVLKSGGTTGKPKFSVFSHDEWEEFTKAFADKLALNGLQAGDRVANLFYVGELYGSFLFTHKVLEDCPTPVLQLPVAGITPLPGILKILKEYEATVIAALPTTLLSIADQIGKPNPAYKVRTILFAGEPMQVDQRERMLSVFPGATVRSIGYASTDAGLLGYCDLGCGPNEFRCYDGEAVYEIVDEVTGAPITRPGVEGRALMTALKRSLMPVLRYPVGDRAVWVDEPGTPDRKYRLLGRSEEAARIGSINIQFEEVRTVLAAFADRLGSFQFQLVVVHLDTRDGLVIRIGSRIAEADRPACERDLTEAIHQARPLYREFTEQRKVRPLQIEWREPSALEINARTGKLRRVIDLRSVSK